MSDDDKPVKLNPNRVRVDFYRLALDWVHLHLQLPRPISARGRMSKYREYGHPAQWASDRAAQIAGIFNSWHDMVSDKRNETPAPPGNAAEKVRVVKAWQYLEPRFEYLAGMVDADDLKEVTELHHQIRNALGFTAPRQILPIPCPGLDCGLRTLTRRQGVGKDFIVCGHCGYAVTDDEEGKNFRWLVTVCLDSILESAGAAS